MSQSPTPAVNLIDPLNPQGVQGAGIISGNLNADADRTLKAAEIASRSALEQARIKSEERLQLAHLDASQKQEAANRESREKIASMEIQSTQSEHEKYQQFQAGEADKQRQFDEQQKQELYARQDKLMKEAQARETQRNQAMLQALKSKTAAEEQFANEQANLHRDAADTARTMSMSQELLARANAGEKVAGDDLLNAVTQQNQADAKAAETAAGAMAYGASMALGKAAENQPNFGQKVLSATVGAGVAGPAAPIVGSSWVVAREIADSIANYFGHDTEHVDKNAMTDAVTFIQQASEHALNEPGAAGILAASGKNPEEARGAVLAAIQAVTASTIAHQGGNETGTTELDQKAEAAIANAKQYVPGSFLNGIFGTLGRVSTDPQLADKMKMVMKPGEKNSRNWKEANEEMFRTVSKIGVNAKRITANEASPAHIPDALPIEQIMLHSAGAAAYLSASPEEGVSRLVHDFGLSPKNAMRVLTQMRERLGGVGDSKHIEAQIRYLQSRMDAVGASIEESKSRRDIRAARGAEEAAAAALSSGQSSGIYAPDDYTGVFGSPTPRE